VILRKFIPSPLSKKRQESYPSTDSDMDETLPPSSAVTRGASADGTAWLQACEKHTQWLASNTMPRSEAFALFGAVHVAVADVLWEQRDDIRAQTDQRVVHLSGSAGLVAVYNIAKRSVQLRTPTTALAQLAFTNNLSLRFLPGSAGQLEGAAARDFQTIPLAMLLWNYAQSSPKAMQEIPLLHKQILTIRRFPQIEPSCLQLRQLRLIHQLSRENLRFDALLESLPLDDAELVCPDLAALYFTGALRIKMH
jgi:hypothetical protein